MICVLMSISLWAQVAILDILHILDCLGQVNADYLQVLYLGRAPCTKETLPDFLMWRRVNRHPLVFRRLIGSQRTPRVWGVTKWAVHGQPTLRTPVPLGGTDFHSHFRSPNHQNRI